VKMPADNPLAVAFSEAIRAGDLHAVERLLVEHGELATARFVDPRCGCACHGGQRAAAERLLACGADIDWVGHDGLTPLDAAVRSDAHELVSWLRSQGAHHAGSD
jgi:ankyrin repeat protein